MERIRSPRRKFFFLELNLSWKGCVALGIKQEITKVIPLLKMAEYSGDVPIQLIKETEDSLEARNTSKKGNGRPRYYRVCSCELTYCYTNAHAPPPPPALASAELCLQTDFELAQ